LYIFDAAPIFVGVMAFAILLPYDLRYGGMFRKPGAAESCGSTKSETQSPAEDNETDEKLKIGEEWL
jgi:hypothetical protein